MIRGKAVTLLLMLLAFLLAGLVGVACGAAEAPTPVPTATPAGVAKPAEIPPTPTPTTKEAKYGGVAVISTRADPPGWDPMFVGTISLFNHATSVYGSGSLVRPCRENVFLVCPGLAEKWEANGDFTQWTFTLRDGLTWHDGKPFTAEDVKFFVDLSMKGVPPGRRPSISAVIWAAKSVEVLAANKVRITLTSPVPAYPNAISAANSMAIAHPRHLMEPEIAKGNATVGPDGVGWVATGPFKVLKYEKGSLFQVRRFDNYWEKDEKGRRLPYLDGIDFPVITDVAAMVAAFRTGRIDVTARGTGFALTPTQRKIIQNELGDKVFFAGWTDTNMGMAPNGLVAPWNDVRVRKALFLWVDRQKACLAILEGDCEVVPMYPAFAPWSDPKAKEWPGFNPATKAQDRAEAKRLLADAGFPNGFKTTLTCRSDWLANCEFYESELRGLLGDSNVRMQIVDSATITQRECDGAFDIISHGGIGGSEAVPWSYAPGLTTTSKCATVKHGDTKVDELMEKAATSVTVDDMVKWGRQIAEYVIKEKAYFSQVFKEVKLSAFRSYFKGFVAPAVSQFNNADYATVWLDK